jgi:hypothetical protein
MGPAQVGVDPAAVDEAFAVLLCEDEELLDAEFEAIMTANGFRADPPSPSLPVRGLPVRDGDAAQDAPSRGWRPWADAVTVHMQRRQRSPPRAPRIN